MMRLGGKTQTVHIKPFVCFTLVMKFIFILSRHGHFQDSYHLFLHAKETVFLLFCFGKFLC